MSQWRSQKQERGDLARVLRAEGKTWVEIAERFRLRYRVNSRVALRWAHGWSQQQAANKWNERWPDDRKTFKNFSYWEVWPSNTGYAPSLDVLNRLAQLYECSVSDVVVDLPDYRHRDKAHDGTWLPGHGGEVGEHYVSPVPKRREMLGYLGAGLMAVGLEQLISTAQQGGLPRVLHALEMTRQTRDGLDTTAMESLSDLVEHYRRRFRSTPPAELYGEILSVRIYASSLLAGRSAPSKLPDVLVAAGWLSNLLALVTLDLGDHAAALVWCADAERRSRDRPS